MKNCTMATNSIIWSNLDIFRIPAMRSLWHTFSMTSHQLGSHNAPDSCSLCLILQITETSLACIQLCWVIVVGTWLIMYATGSCLLLAAVSTKHVPVSQFFIRCIGVRVPSWSRLWSHNSVIHVNTRGLILWVLWGFIDWLTLLSS